MILRIAFGFCCIRPASETVLTVDDKYRFQGQAFLRFFALNKIVVVGDNSIVVRLFSKLALA